MKEKMKIKPLLIAVIAFSLLIVHKNLVAQSKSFHFEHLTKNNGLASNRVNCIYQDSVGFIWFGTAEGLQKFDGYSFETFQYDPNNSNTISDNRINCIIKDIISDNFWIGTEHGLNYFDRSTNKFTQLLHTTDSIGLVSNQVYVCYVDSRNQLWVGTSNGLSRLDLLSRKFTNYKHSTNDPKSILSNIVNSIFEDSDGNVWIGTRLGLSKFNSSDDNFTSFSEVLINKEIRFIYEDILGRFWIGTNSHGIFRFKDRQSEGDFTNFRMDNSPLINNRAYCIVAESSGNLFIGIRDGGLLYFDIKTNEFIAFTPDIRLESSLNSKALISMFIDRSGIIWMGTYNSGLNKLDNHRKKFFHYKVNFKETGLFNNNIRSLFEDSQGYIWVGTKDGGGLSRFNKNTDTFQHFKPNPSDPFSLSDDYVFSINEINDRFLLVGTFRKGLEILDKQTGKFQHFVADSTNRGPVSSRVYNIYKDIDGDIWLGTATHIEKFDPKNKTFTRCISVNRALCFYPENKDVFWVGTSQLGLHQYNKKTGRFKSYNNQSIDSVLLSTYGISSLVKDNNGRLWIGSYGGGISSYDSTGKERRMYTTQTGLPSNNVCGLLVDEQNNIWISTTNGISKFNPINGTFINYSAQDGLQGNEFENFVSLKIRDGQLMFGGNNGFNIFNPNDIKSNPTPPVVVITGFKIFNKPVKVGEKNSPLKNHISNTKELILKHDYSVVTFEFIALNYTSPEKNQYAYKLDGFEKEWNYVGSARNATYTNLAAGDYVFRVKASNNDGVWNEVGTSIKVEVLPPLWKTFWAYLFYAIILFFLINALRIYAVNRTKARNELLIERLKHEKSEEVNQLKLQFFTNISHEFRTPLTLILGPIQCLIDTNKDEENKSTLLTIRKNANILHHLVNQLMDLRKIDTGNMRLKAIKGDIIEFVGETASSFNMLAEEHSINFSIFNKPSSFVMWYDQEKVENIVVNLLANAFKFTPDNGEITVNVNVINLESSLLINDFSVQKVLEIQIKDSGIGIPKDSLNEIFNRFYQVKRSKSAYLEGTGIGLSLVKDLVTLLKGEILVESEEGKGTCFTVRLPADDRFIEEDNKVDIVEPFESVGIRKLRSYATSAFETINYSNKEPKENKSPDYAPVVLLIDDNVDIRNYIINQLQHKYCFEQADNGTDGFDKAMEYQPDLIISDVLMPELDGIELCKKLKTEIQTSHIPIILLTALTSLEYEIEGIETGADAFISKPFSIELLDVHIKNLIESRKNLMKRFELDICLKPKDITINSIDKDFLEQSMDIIEKYMSKPDFDVQLFVDEIGMSRTVLYRKLKAVTGLSVNEFINTVRLKRAVQLLEQKKLSVSEIAYEVGFSSPKYFSTCFRKQFHKTPSEFIAGL